LKVFESSTTTISSDDVGVSLYHSFIYRCFLKFGKNIDLFKEERLDIAESLNDASVLLDPRFKKDFLTTNKFDYPPEA
jgi:hypothetical protein